MLAGSQFHGQPRDLEKGIPRHVRGSGAGTFDCIKQSKFFQAVLRAGSEAVLLAINAARVVPRVHGSAVSS